MTVIDVVKDLEGAVLTIVTEHEATMDEVWRLWSDPRLLERWWGPPSHPATVTAHELTGGGGVRYFMTAQDGERYHGGWHVVRVDRPRGIEVEDFFADEDGNEHADLPRTAMRVSIEDVGAGITRMTITSRYPSQEAMSKVLEMGMEEGVRQALGQIDDLLAERSG